MVASNPCKGRSRAAALVDAGVKLALVRDAMVAGAALNAACRTHGLPAFSVDRWTRRDNPPAHAEILAEIRDLHARRKLRPKGGGRLLQGAKSRRPPPPPNPARAAQAARVAEKNQGGKIPDDALTVREAASITGRSVATVQNWMKQRKLRAFYRLTAESGIEALMSRADVERVVESQRGPGVAAHERAMQRHASKIPMAVDLIRSGVLKKHACASVGIPVTTLNLWRRTSRTLESGVSLLAEVKDATKLALDDKRQALAERMARMVGAVKAGATVREAAKEMGESEHAPGLWLHGLSGCEDLCARFRVEWAAAKRQGHERRQEYKATMRTPPKKLGRPYSQKEKAPRPKFVSGSRSKAGWVYFIQDVDARGNIKIGFTTHTVDKRIAQLSTGSPVRLVAIRQVRAARAFERWAHERFNEERQHGEWFRPTPRLLMFIQRLADHPDLTLTDPSVIQGLSQGNPLFYEVHRAAT